LPDDKLFDGRRPDGAWPDRGWRRGKETCINFQENASLNQMQGDQETGSVKTSLDRAFDALEDAAMNADAVALFRSVVAHQRGYPE